MFIFYLLIPNNQKNIIYSITYVLTPQFQEFNFGEYQMYG